MSEVKRYWVPNGTLDGEGWHQDDNEVVLASEHDRVLAALREELAESNELYRSLAMRSDVAAAVLNEQEAELEDVQQRLTAAEQRNAELVAQRKLAEQEVIVAVGLLKRASSEIESLASSLENACEDFEGEEDEDPQATEEVDFARKLAAQIRAIWPEPAESGASE